MKVVRTDGVVVEVTKKAYNLLYKPRGWKVYKEQEKPKKDDTELNKLTKKELTEKAQELGVDINTSMTKAEIIKALEV